MATYQEKLDRITNTLVSRTGLTNIVPGSIAGQLGQSIAFEQMNLENELETDSIKNSLLLAKGRDLDKIGSDFFGTRRRPQIRTSITGSMKLLKFYVATGTFGSINSNNDMLVPQGTIIEGKLDLILVRFRLTKDTILPAAANEVFISAELIQGPNNPLPSRTLNKHYFSAYSKSLNNLLLVTNTSVVATGRPEETDENFRYRLVKSFSAFTKTNTDGISEVVNSVPGVSFSHIDQSSNGGGTFAIYVQGMSPVTSDEVLMDVEFALNGQLGPWVNYNVAKMNYIGLVMSLNVITSNPSYYVANAAFIANIQDIVSSYINNFFGTECEINLLLTEIRNSNRDITAITFNSVDVFSGINVNRASYRINFAGEPAPVISLSPIEKIIIEPIQNSILVQVS